MPDGVHHSDLDTHLEKLTQQMTYPHTCKAPWGEQV